MTATTPTPHRPADDWLDDLLRQAAQADDAADEGFTETVLRALPAARPMPTEVPVAPTPWGSAFWRPVVCSLGLALLLLCGAALWPQWQALMSGAAVLAQQPAALADPRVATQWLEPLLALITPLVLWLWWSLALVQERWSAA